MRPEPAQSKRAAPRTSIRLPCSILVALGSGGCAFEVPLGPERRGGVSQFRQVIIERLDQIFGAAVLPTEVAISRATRAPLEARHAWRFCLRSDLHTLTGPRAYVVFVEDGKVIHHEPARAEHACQSENFERLSE